MNLKFLYIVTIVAMNYFLPTKVGELTPSTMTSLKSSSSIIKDYLMVPGPIGFMKKNYSLSFSAHPSPTYFQQEYITKGELPEKYNEMVMVQLMFGEMKIQDAVASKIKQLQLRKANDIMVNFKVTNLPKSGEIILEFTLSDGQGAAKIAEWNVYRYHSYSNITTKQTGISLFGFSKRFYGAKAYQLFNDANNKLSIMKAEFLKLHSPDLKPSK